MRCDDALQEQRTRRRLVQATLRGASLDRLDSSGSGICWPGKRQKNNAFVKKAKYIIDPF